ncbi:thioesterase II family protein [Serratia microhaemolytica]|uniref:thioesterase II family protein n=1 Tax=Serratia microhaemolytica TaxID=2675110 RepID=UPI0013922EE8|nr:alpha/beta fold hydrolase [Serratia microhaemolytica]
MTIDSIASLNISHKRPDSSWLVRLNQPRRASLRLFCFPYAGGSSQVFRNWPQLIDSEIELIAVQLPGRGTRLHEPAISSVEILVEQITAVIQTNITTGRFAFFGHSMGAMIMFEVARALKAQKQPQPECLFASGCQAPQWIRAPRNIAAMSDEAFIAWLRQLQGTPAAIFNNSELLQVLLPMLRSDFAAVDGWQFVPSAPLSVPIIAMAGCQDAQISVPSVGAWSEQTIAKFELLTYSGGHFFIHEQEKRVVAAVNEQLRSLMFG